MYCGRLAPLMALADIAVTCRLALSACGHARQWRLDHRGRQRPNQSLAVTFGRGWRVNSNKQYVRRAKGASPQAALLSSLAEAASYRMHESGSLRHC